MATQKMYKRNIPYYEGEKNTKPTKVELGSYVDQNSRIRNFIAAGEVLKEDRKFYDFEGKIDENLDITVRGLEYDIIDAKRDLEMLEKRMEEAEKIKAQRDKMKAEAEQKRLDELEAFYAQHSESEQSSPE
jgi:Skp family chaperone for outer membrane proteins